MRAQDQDPRELSEPLKDVRIVSFDAEGTLVSTDFSLSVWQEAIPRLYAEKNGIELERAREIVFTQYDRIGDQRLEWYDINYWLRNLELGTLQPVIEGCLDRICRYPEVDDVLSSLARRYSLIVCSGTPTELLDPLLEGIRSYFFKVFSSTSHYRELKTPSFFGWVCHTVGAEPRELVHIGDSWQFDYENPKEVGIRAFHLDRSGLSNGSLASLRHLQDMLLD